MKESYRIAGICLLLVYLTSRVASFTSLNGRFPLIYVRNSQNTRIWAETDDEEDVSLEAFKARKRKQQEEEAQRSRDKSDLDEFDGYAMRDAILEKWGRCFDVDFNRVDSFGFKNLYLNVLPFHLGGRRFRHETELDYLCHLQAVVEILRKYDQLGYVLAQIDETNKKPRAGTSPLVAVPLRLDLSREQVEEILG